MKKQKSILLFACLLGVFSHSCEYLIKSDDRFSFVNSSQEDVYVSFDTLYPDTSIYDPNPAFSPETNKVLAGETSKSVLRLRSNWEATFKDIPSDTLMVFVFDAQVLETTTWDTVKANYQILKRYDLSLQDVKDMDWTISYP